MIRGKKEEMGREERAGIGGKERRKTRTRKKGARGRRRRARQGEGAKEKAREKTWEVREWFSQAFEGGGVEREKGSSRGQVGGRCVRRGKEICMSIRTAKSVPNEHCIRYHSNFCTHNV